MGAEDHTGEHYFDELARGLASGTVSRSKALRMLGAALVGGVLASVPGVAWAAKPPGQKGCRIQGQTRVNGQCVCPASAPTTCGNQCVNTQTDLAHCGGCNQACTAPANATATCAAGQCGFVCNPGSTAIGNSCCPTTQVCGTGASANCCPSNQGCLNGTCLEMCPTELCCCSCYFRDPATGAIVATCQGNVSSSVECDQICRTSTPPPGMVFNHSNTGCVFSSQNPLRPTCGPAITEGASGTECSADLLCAPPPA